MTLPYEEKWALQRTHVFLVALLNPKDTPRVPRSVRDMASRCLKHYPMDYTIEKIYEGKDSIVCQKTQNHK